MAKNPSTEVVLAAASGSTDGVGKIGTIAATSGTLIVRCPNPTNASQIDYRVKSDQVYSVQLYRARSVVNAATITIGTAALDDDDTFILNGLTYKAEATAASAAFASRYFSVAGNTAAQCAAIAACINADYTVVPDGSVAVGNTLVIATTDDASTATNTYTFTAAATPNYTTSVFDQSGNQAAELASIVLAINHKRNVTCASVAAGDKVKITDKNGTVYTFTAHATTTTAANREFAMNGGSDTAVAAELVTCINDGTYGATGYTASQTAGVVWVARNSASVAEPVITSSNATRLACVNVRGGVPGVVAAATGATGELAITPTWVKSMTVTAPVATHLTVTNIDNPGLYAVAGATTVTLSCTTPGNPAGGKQATTIQFNQGTSDANEATFASTTLTYLTLDGAAKTSQAANSTTSNGALFTQWIDGWDQGYILISNGSGSAQTVTVAATKY